MKMTDADIRIKLQFALLGEVYNEIVAIAYKYEKTTKLFLLRYYMEREPNDEDRENLSCVMSEFIANYDNIVFNEIKEECIKIDLAQSKVDPLDGLVYLKKQ
ncbi:MAG: hypothetical protein V2A54_11750 [Bacteroidota bacterium]